MVELASSSQDASNLSWDDFALWSRLHPIGMESAWRGSVRSGQLQLAELTSITLKTTTTHCNSMPKITYALSKFEYNKFCNYKTARDMWDAIQITYEWIEDI
ncbi:hypothetical protein CR513_46159, partial [Mucuna pruriens]